MSNHPVSAIRARLSTLVTAVTEIKQVKTGHTINFDQGFPAAKIYFTGVGSPLLENTNTQNRQWNFAIEVVQEMNAKSTELAEANFQDAVEAVLNAIQNDGITLDDDADFAEIGNTKAFLNDGAQGLQVSAIIPVTISSYEDSE